MQGRIGLILQGSFYAKRERFFTSEYVAFLLYMIEMVPHPFGLCFGYP